MARLEAMICLAIRFVLLFGCAAAFSKAQNDLEARMDALEHHSREQARLLLMHTETIKRLEAKIDSQTSRMVYQEQTINELKARVLQLEDEVKQSTAKHDISCSNSSYNDHGLKNIEKMTSSRKVPVRSMTSGGHSRIRRYVSNPEGMIAFHAIVKTPTNVEHIGIGQKIVFPDVMLNLGGGYHNQHGLFVAPRPGLYLFSTSIMSSVVGGHQEIYVHLMKNGVVLANAFAHSDSDRPDQGSVTIVTQLVAGDEVWVSLFGPADTKTYGDEFDSFMGILVIPE